MKGFFSYAMCSLLLCGCGRQQQNASHERREAAELIETRMSQFAASNNATVLTIALTNWRSLTADIEDAFKRDGKSVVVELIFPDANRDESGNLVLEGDAISNAPTQVRVEALITTNMLPQVRASRSEMGGLWLVMNVESVRRRPIANDNEEFLLRGRAVAVEARSITDLGNHLATPAAGK